MNEIVNRGRLIPLLRADPHRWGAGLVHKIDVEQDKILCGKTPANCPGTKFDGIASQITCKICLRAIESRKRSELIQREWAKQRAVEEAAREDRRRQWWQNYNAYLLSPTWRNKRDLVLKRAAGTCEGCGAQRAAQVHHLRYPQDCRPGSPEWIAREKLFDLRAVCTACHDDIHS